MPQKDPKARRLYDAARMLRLRLDPELGPKLRAKEAANQRERMKDPVKKAKARECALAWRNKGEGDNQRFSHIKNKYGIDRSTWESMYKAQRGLCAICGKPESTREPRTGKTRMLAVDHCHLTGRVRGLLCYFCNVGIGFLRHRTDFLAQAIIYLRSNECSPEPGTEDA